MIARVKYDLRELYKHIKIGTHNKYWGKMLNVNNRHMTSGHKAALFNALRNVKVCDSTIEQLKDVNMSHSIFNAICMCPLYTKIEKQEILTKFKDKVDWYYVYDKTDLDLDFKIDYYEEIKQSYLTRYRGDWIQADSIFKDIEREFKIRQLLDEV